MILAGHASGTKARQTTYTNAELTAGDTISIVTGRDAYLVGANIRAGVGETDPNYNPLTGSIYMDIGRDLTFS